MARKVLVAVTVGLMLSVAQAAEQAVKDPVGQVEVKQLAMPAANPSATPAGKVEVRQLPDPAPQKKQSIALVEVTQLPMHATPAAPARPTSKPAAK